MLKEKSIIFMLENIFCELFFQDLKFTSLENNEAPHPGICVVPILISTGNQLILNTVWNK